MSDPIQKRSLRRSTPEEQGLQSQRILAFLDALDAGKYNMHSLMLVRHGAVIAEGWWAPYDPGCRRYVYSLSKSFTSTAVGFAVFCHLCPLPILFQSSITREFARHHIVSMQT